MVEWSIYQRRRVIAPKGATSSFSVDILISGRGLSDTNAFHGSVELLGVK